jgi:hypothetical protein
LDRMIVKGNRLDHGNPSRINIGMKDRLQVFARARPQISHTRIFH